MIPSQREKDSEPIWILDSFSAVQCSAMHSISLQGLHNEDEPIKNWNGIGLNVMMNWSSFSRAHFVNS